MAYYLGRDIDIAITTEHDEYGIGLVTTSNEQTAGALDFNKPTDSNSVAFVDATHADLLFAGPRNTGTVDTNAAHDPWKGTITGDDGTFLDVNWTNVPKNITGLDLSFGVQDEDVAFVGQRSVLKAEIKKDNSVTITRKKSDSVWSVIYNDARFGLAEEPAADGYYPLPSSTTNPFHEGLSAPDYVTCGYRIYLRFGGTPLTAGEVFILRNCYITEYSVTLGADASQEESLTLQSYIDPIIFSGTLDDSFDTATVNGALNIMAYYTGRDVDVYWTTEHDSAGINEHTDFELRMTEAPDSANETIVRPLVDLGEGVTKLTDVTGVDVSVGSQDEDITYMGLRNVGKIEVKKDTSITITMKKKDRKFLQLFQGSTYSVNSNNGVGGHPARWGILQTLADINIQDGTVDPKSCVDPDATTKSTYGFRLAVEFKASSTDTGTDGALLIIPNCTLSEVTHTTSNEAADEESVTFTSQVKPMIGDGKRVGADGAFVTYATATTLLSDV